MNRRYALKTGERIFISLNLIFSIIILYASRSLPAGAEFGIGPGFLPKCISYFSILLSIILLSKSFLNKKSAVENEKFADRKGFLRMLITFLLLVLAIVLMRFIGMIIPLILFLVIVFRFIEKYSTASSIKVAVFSVMIFYAIFRIWLGVPIQII